MSSAPGAVLMAARADPMLETMFHEIECAAPVYRPSRFWENLNKINLSMLSEHGLENLKRTVAQNYFNWLVIRGADNQLRRVFAAWLRRPSLQPFLNVLERPELLKTTMGLEKEVGRKELLIYKLFVGMLWEIASHNDKSKLAEKLEEPLVGNPITLRRRGRRISQDLANSIREFNTVLEADPSILGHAKRVAELGAGYGRLGHVFLSDPGTRYFIFDIPPALYVSQWYLSQLFAQEKIFRFRHIEDFQAHAAEISCCRIGFFTPNQIELFPEKFFDVFANISTLAEMTEAQNRNYMHHIQRTTAHLVYLKQWSTWRNPDDARTFTKEDVALTAPFRCTLDRIDAVQDQFFEQVWRLDS